MSTQGQPPNKQSDSEKVSLINKPSEFMRTRRPKLFSDSEIKSESFLAKEVFDNQLDTITSRKQEIEFEHFIRRLLEKEICPNLIPQTGPTGGGDSKVDTETYPVSDEIADLWYVRQENNANNERWAFAISAKKDWQSKISADVKKIVSTKRDYKLIYFVTNQYVQDKKRASIEDNYKNKEGIEVRILDRNWIIKCIYEHNRLDLAIETLHITDAKQIDKKSFGTNDIERQDELNQLEQRLENLDYYQGVIYQQAEDSLRAALLARGLELPRVEVEGRFCRAERYAKKHNNSQQLLRIIYQKAWTTYWWFDDFESFNTIYSQVEELALESQQAPDLEMLTNLWQLIHTLFRNKFFDGEYLDIEGRTHRLYNKLTQLVNDPIRPNNSLQAQLNITLIDFAQALLTNGPYEVILNDFRVIIQKSEGLAEFPVRSLTDFIIDLGDRFTNNSTYDLLFECVVNLTEKRKSLGNSGSILLNRGFQYLKAEKPIDAIRLLGRAQQKLAFHEYRKEWVTSVLGCGLAFSSAGLLWAAHNNILIATNLALSDYLKHGDLNPIVHFCALKMQLIEIQLGRIPNILAWIEFSEIIKGKILKSEKEIQEIKDEENGLDLVLAILFLNCSLENLALLNFLPNFLENYELPISRCALLYALGYEEEIISCGYFEQQDSKQEIFDYFTEILNQPCKDYVPKNINLISNNLVSFQTYILGCKITVQIDNNLHSISFAETILGALEALLATSLNEFVVSYRSDLLIKIQPSEKDDELPKYEFDEKSAGAIVHILYNKVPFTKTPENRQKFRNWLRNLVVDIALNIIIVADIKDFTKKIIEEEYSLERASNYSDLEIALENIFGEYPKFQMQSWIDINNKQLYPILRKEPWDLKLNKNSVESLKTQKAQPDNEEMPLVINNLLHRDQRFVSLINPRLWDRAKWTATEYLFIPNRPPMIAIGFSDGESAKQIFQDFKNQLGESDNDERIRFSIVKGIDKKKPFSYRVVISTNLPTNNIPQSRNFLLLSRINTMDSTNPSYLSNFLKVFNLAKCFILLPVVADKDNLDSEPFWDLGIIKHELIVKEAWQVGLEDSEVVAILKGDDPIIPEGINNPPIISVLNRLDGHKHRKRH